MSTALLKPPESQPVPDRNASPPTGDAFQVIERSSLTHSAYKQIRKALMVGELKPGQKLSGRRIALRLGISLTPVREALLQMVAEGILESRTGQSIIVPYPTRAVFAELRDIRIEVEGLAAERAASRIDTRAIAELAEIQDKLIQAKRDHEFAAALEYNEAFHLGLAQHSGMPRLCRVVEGLWAQSGPFLNFLYSGPEWRPVGTAPHMHEFVLDAFKQRDGVAARQAIVEDIARGGAWLLARLPE